MLTLSARLKLAIEAEAPARGRYAFLCARTSVPAATWRTWWTRGGVPNGALVEAAASLWPQYAFWLATGCTDENCGHVKPGPAAQAHESRRTECSKAYLQALQAAPRSAVEADSPHGAAALAALGAIAVRRMDEIASNFEHAIPVFPPVLDQR